MEQKNLSEILLAMSEYHTGSGKDATEAIAAIYDAGMMIVDQTPHCAKVSWATEILRTHNLWRRGDDTKDPTNPTDLGNAIEIAIGVLDRSNRAQPKYKRVDLEEAKIHPRPYNDKNVNADFNIYNQAIDDIKSKYGDIYVVIKK